MCCNQNCHEKVFNRELYICAGGLDILKMIIPLVYSVSYFNLGGLELCLREIGPLKPSRGDRTGCNLAVGIVLNVRFTMNEMRMKNNTHLYVTWTSNISVISIVVCCHMVKFCTLNAQALRLHHMYLFFVILKMDHFHSASTGYHSTIENYFEFL